MNLSDINFIISGDLSCNENIKQTIMDSSRGVIAKTEDGRFFLIKTEEIDADLLPEFYKKEYKEAE